MPEKKHLRGVSAKEQRQYEHIKEDAKKSGRYGKRAEEVAARHPALEARSSHVNKTYNLYKQKFSLKSMFVNNY